MSFFELKKKKFDDNFGAAEVNRRKMVGAIFRFFVENRKWKINCEKSTTVKEWTKDKPLGWELKAGICVVFTVATAASLLSM